MVTLKNSFALGDVRLEERTVIRHEDADQMADFHADLVVGEERAVQFAVADEDFRQQAEAFGDDDAGSQAGVCHCRPIVGIRELRAGDHIAHLTLLHILREDAALVSKSRVEQVHAGQPQFTRDDQIARIEGELRGLCRRRRLPWTGCRWLSRQLPTRPN